MSKMNVKDYQRKDTKNIQMGIIYIIQIQLKSLILVVKNIYMRLKIYILGCAMIVKNLLVQNVSQKSTNAVGQI